VTRDDVPEVCRWVAPTDALAAFVRAELVNPYPEEVGDVFPGYPDPGSELCLSGFFASLYRHYDLRFVYGAANLRNRTQRLTWHPESPALQAELAHDFASRVAAGDD